MLQLILLLYYYALCGMRCVWLRVAQSCKYSRPCPALWLPLSSSSLSPHVDRPPYHMLSAFTLSGSLPNSLRHRREGVAHVLCARHTAA